MKKTVKKAEKKNILITDDDRVNRTLLSGVLRKAGYAVTTANDGLAARAQLKKKKCDLLLLDLWMPRMNGLELLTLLRQEAAPPRVVVMTSDQTPETMLRAVREQAYRYLTKPVDTNELLDLVENALSSKPTSPPIEVLSARPTWVELLVPCDFDSAHRIQSFLERLEADLSQEVRQSIGQAFRELLMNAIEWGGKLDPNRKVRISCLRANKMLIYRIADPGPGFRFEGLSHAAVSNPDEQPLEHARIREEKGLRPGGLGLLMTRALVDELLYNEAQNEVLFVKYLA